MLPLILACSFGASDDFPRIIYPQSPPVRSCYLIFPSLFYCPPIFYRNGRAFITLKYSYWEEWTSQPTALRELGCVKQQRNYFNDEING
jgi:hypothetical protein